MNINNELSRGISFNADYSFDEPKLIEELCLLCSIEDKANENYYMCLGRFSANIDALCAQYKQNSRLENILNISFDKGNSVARDVNQVLEILGLHRKNDRIVDLQRELENFALSQLLIFSKGNDLMDILCVFAHNEQLVNALWDSMERMDIFSIFGEKKKSDKDEIFSKKEKAYADFIYNEPKSEKKRQREEDTAPNEPVREKKKAKLEVEKEENPSVTTDESKEKKKNNILEKLAAIEEEIEIEKKQKGDLSPAKALFFLCELLEEEQYIPGVTEKNEEAINFILRSAKRLLLIAHPDKGGSEEATKIVNTLVGQAKFALELLSK